jgi:hypothetical protein
MMISSIPERLVLFDYLHYVITDFLHKYIVSHLQSPEKCLIILSKNIFLVIVIT